MTESGDASCPNCGAARRGPYCHDCGQRLDLERLTERHLLEDLVTTISNLDSSLWRTLRGLSLRPGEVARDYVEGRRRRWLSPVQLFLVSITVYFVTAAFIGMSPQDAFQPEQPIDNVEVAEVMDSLMALTRQHERHMALVTTPILAILYRIAFRRSGRNTAETLVFTIYSAAFLQLVAGIPFLVVLRVLPSLEARWIAWFGWVLVMFSYQAWMAVRFFGLGTVETIARALLAFLAWMGMLMAMPVALLFFAGWIAAH